LNSGLRQTAPYWPTFVIRGTRGNKLGGLVPRGQRKAMKSLQSAAARPLA